MNGSAVLIKAPQEKQIEQEFNVVLFSGDRDWLNNTQENRYNFTANFRIANNGVNKPLNPVVQKSFKNVKILELTKVTIPAEGIDMLVRRKNTPTNTNTDVLVSALTLPYITVNVKEWVNNNYGTNNYIDRSFGILQYDANWMEDPISIDSNTMTLTRGYYGMLPKFLTCQRKFDPTPLATLTKLSFQILRPSGDLLSGWDDTFNISNIILQNQYGSNYYIVQTTQYFPRHMVNIGDRIVIGGFSTPSNVSSSLNQFSAGFTSFINQPQGFYVADCGIYSNSNITFNNVGYGNAFAIDAYNPTPTIGTVPPAYFTNSTDASNFFSFMASNTLTGCRAINMSHQTTTYLKITTTSYDAGSLVRADNI